MPNIRKIVAGGDESHLAWASAQERQIRRSLEGNKATGRAGAFEPQAGGYRTKKFDMGDGTEIEIRVQPSVSYIIIRGVAGSAANGTYVCIPDAPSSPTRTGPPQARVDIAKGKVSVIERVNLLGTTAKWSGTSGDEIFFGGSQYIYYAGKKYFIGTATSVHSAAVVYSPNKQAKLVAVATHRYVLGVESVAISVLDLTKDVLSTGDVAVGAPVWEFSGSYGMTYSKLAFNTNGTELYESGAHTDFVQFARHFNGSGTVFSVLLFEKKNEWLSVYGYSYGGNKTQARLLHFPVTLSNEGVLTVIDAPSVVVVGTKPKTLPSVVTVPTGDDSEPADQPGSVSYQSDNGSPVSSYTASVNVSNSSSHRTSECHSTTYASSWGWDAVIDFGYDMDTVVLLEQSLTATETGTGFSDKVVSGSSSLVGSDIGSGTYTNDGYEYTRTGRVTSYTRTEESSATNRTYSYTLSVRIGGAVVFTDSSTNTTSGSSARTRTSSINESINQYGYAHGTYFPGATTFSPHGPDFVITQNTVTGVYSAHATNLPPPTLTDSGYSGGRVTARKDTLVSVHSFCARTRSCLIAANTVVQNKTYTVNQSGGMDVSADVITHDAKLTVVLNGATRSTAVLIPPSTPDWLYGHADLGTLRQQSSVTTIQNLTGGGHSFVDNPQWTEYMVSQSKDSAIVSYTGLFNGAGAIKVETLLNLDKINAVFLPTRKPISGLFADGGLTQFKLPPVRLAPTGFGTEPD